MDWKIEFCMEKYPDPVFLHNFINYLVSRGVTYNKYGRGEYTIRPEESVRSIHYIEKTGGDLTGTLTDIVNQYSQFDLSITTLGIYLNYSGEADFGFLFKIVPNNRGKCWISFQKNSSDIPDDKTFLAWVNLCRDVFVRFNFPYGGLRDEYEDIIPLNTDEFLKELPNYVNYYSRPLVERFGLEKLLSAPAAVVGELENGGVMIVVCPLHAERIGCPDEIWKLWSYLGYGKNG